MFVVKGSGISKRRYILIAYTGTSVIVIFIRIPFTKSQKGLSQMTIINKDTCNWSLNIRKNMYIGQNIISLVLFGIFYFCIH